MAASGALAAPLALALVLSPVSAAPGTPRSAAAAHDGARQGGAATEPRSDAGLRGRAIEGAAALDPFFAALEALEAGGGGDPRSVVRILHFGDSHTLADAWTGRIRGRLQARFGDAGPGLVLPAPPWRGWGHAGVEQRYEKSWKATSFRSRGGDAWVGLTGAALFVPPGSAYRVAAPFGAFRVYALGPADAPPPDVRLAHPAARVTDVRAIPLEGDLRTLSVVSGLSRVAGAAQELSVALPEGSRLLGVELRSGERGILYDELGLGGATLFETDRANHELRRALLREARADLVVLAYGTNDLARKDLEAGGYRRKAREVIGRFLEESGAPALLLGPMDRSSKVRRKAKELRAAADLVVDELRLAARDAGCAFWDVRAAMGGPGSIDRWRARGLAQPDLIHLSPQGYRDLADLEERVLMDAFAAFRRRSP